MLLEVEVFLGVFEEGLDFGGGLDDVGDGLQGFVNFDPELVLVAV